MNNKGFMGFIGLLIVVVIISFLAYFVYTKYLLKPTGMDNQTKAIAEDSGINTSSQASILESAKSKINDIQDAQKDQSQQLVNALGQ